MSVLTNEQIEKIKESQRKFVKNALSNNIFSNSKISFNKLVIAKNGSGKSYYASSKEYEERQAKIKHKEKMDKILKEF